MDEQNRVRVSEDNNGWLLSSAVGVEENVEINEGEIGER